MERGLIERREVLVSAVSFGITMIVIVHKHRTKQGIRGDTSLTPLTMNTHTIGGSLPYFRPAYFRQRSGNTDPNMTSDVHTLLNHYNINTLYPSAWPAEKDESDTSNDEQPTNKTKRPAHSQAKSRYSALIRSGSDRRSLVPGSEKTGDGIENLVQKDEPDPLGGPDSVVRILRQQGLPVEEDQRLRERACVSRPTHCG